MQQIELRAENRELFGKRTKRLRTSGIIPVVLYGPKIDSLALQIPERELHLVLSAAGTNRLIRLWLDAAEEPRVVLIRDVQRDSITHSLLHVDFYEVVMTEKITAQIPINIVGESPAVANKGGLLVRGLDSLDVHCLPGQLEDAIEVDISALEDIDQAILVKDLDVGEGIEILSNPDEVVAQVLTVREEVVEEVLEVEEEVAEVEVLGPVREAEEELEEELPEAVVSEGEEEEPEAE
jgi:large subunit ribosomal protein L25